MPNLIVVDDPAAAAAERLAEAVSAGQQIALTGGSTPRACYELLAAKELDWSRTALWFSDERAVPADSELSNYAMARAALLDRLPGPAPVVHRMRGEIDHHEAAAAYESLLREHLDGELPVLDMLMLGLGGDGHCASLFPGQDTLDESQRAVIGVDVAGMDPRVPRISFTLPLINAAREVLFLVSGESKSEPAARAFAAEPSRETPASLVAPAPGRLTVLLDPAAAAGL